MIEHRILNNFVSGSTFINQSVIEIFSIMFKTYFWELVLGFSPDRNKTTAEMFSGKWLSIIIEKKWKFQLAFAKGRKNVWKRRGQFYLNSYNSWTEWDIFTKLRTHVYGIVFWSD